MTVAVMVTPRRFLALGLLLLTGCISRGIDAPPFIPPIGDATLAELIAIVNERREIQTLTARANIQFETREGEEEGRFRRFRSARGRILLSRPESIRLQIEAPVLGVNLAEMASDGRAFQLLIYPEDYRALIVGRNDREYPERTREMEDDPELKKAGPLVNIRPQHFTTAFLFDPIDTADPNVIAVMEEARRLVEDDRPTAQGGQIIIKSYYVLSVIHRGETSPRLQYWFDRSGGLELTGLKSFNSQGSLIGDVNYSDYVPTELGTSLATEIYIVRPYDRYALRITMEAETLGINRDIPETAFSIEAPEEWGESVRRVDLDRNGA